MWDNNKYYMIIDWIFIVLHQVKARVITMSGAMRQSCFINNLQRLRLIHFVRNDRFFTFYEGINFNYFLIVL